MMWIIIIIIHIIKLSSNVLNLCRFYTNYFNVYLYIFLLMYNEVNKADVNGLTISLVEIR